MISHRHTDTLTEGRQASRGRLSVRRGRVVATASVMALVPMVTGFPQVTSPARAHPVKSHVRQVALVKTPVAAMRTARDATTSRPRTPGAPDPIRTARAGAVTPVQNVAGAVTVVGVTWPRGSVSAQSAQSARSQFQIRTRSGATWGRWQPLDVEAGAADPAEARAARGGTNPYIITGATAYQVRSLTTDAQVPAAATVQAVDPGTSSADSLQQEPGAAVAAAARPTIYTRAQWGADERLRRTAPSYGKVMVGFVHHTDNANSYTAGAVPAMIRGIYAYHVQTLGWSDVGYNFLVDRFGRIWEGRYGGMDKAVVGAQTLNFNSVSTGVSVIGNFQVAAPPQVVTDALKRVLAWKLSLAGIPATGSVLANGKYLQRVSGHRDAYPTDCPGQYLYARLPEIRAGAAALMSAKPPTPVPPVVTPPVSPWAVTRYTPYKGVVLQQGSRGWAVVVLQRGLKVTADGDFGPMTRAAVVAFERLQRIPVNGIANRVVWDRLEKRDYPLIAYRGLTLRQGSTGAVVVVLQRALRINPDGAFGPLTAAAVRAVQRSAKLAQTGVVSGGTWVAIENRMPR